MNPKRELALSTALLTLGGILGWLAVGRHWATARPVDRTGHVVEIPLTGRQLGVSAVLPIACLAAAGAVLATRRLGRVAVGVLALALAAGFLADGALNLGRASSTAGHDTKVTVLGTGNTFPPVHPTGWAVLGLLAGVLALLGALPVAVRGRRWPALGAAYDAPTAKRDKVHAGPQGVWDALDRGEDPT